MTTFLMVLRIICGVFGVVTFCVLAYNNIMYDIQPSNFTVLQVIILYLVSTDRT